MLRTTSWRKIPFHTQREKAGVINFLVHCTKIIVVNLIFPLWAEELMKSFNSVKLHAPFKTWRPVPFSGENPHSQKQIHTEILLNQSTSNNNSSWTRKKSVQLFWCCWHPIEGICSSGLNCEIVWAWLFICSCFLIELGNISESMYWQAQHLY